VGVREVVVLEMSGKKALVCACAVVVGCSATSTKDSASDPLACGTDAAHTACASPTQTAEYYAAKSSEYFDTMDYRVELEEWPPYGEQVARWEWPPWLKLTAFGRDNIEAADTLLQLYPSIVEDRDCRGFDTQPFGRCTVVFYYDDHEGLGCPIYEEFVFNDDGEITWIEAWSDLDGMRPTTADDPWSERDGAPRLSDRIPGLGTPTGAIDLDSDAMHAARADSDVDDFVVRANDWYPTWSAELAAAGDGMWAEGCGW